VGATTGVRRPDYYKTEKETISELEGERKGRQENLAVPVCRVTTQ